MWFERLPDHDWSEYSIHSLLDPGDSQNVPSTIRLLLCIVDLGDLDPNDYDPSEAAELEALGLLGETFDALVQPFINTYLSLSEQIESLVKFAHLTCGLYLQNGTSFMPNQLYSDLQAMVKNAVLTVPKTRLIDGKLKVFICLLGDDVLESLFGRCRMIGGHSPNCSVCELRARFGSAMNLDYIYERHPELERKPRRLKLVRSRDLDHLRPSQWQGEITASSCDLEKCWRAAVKAAEDILKKYGVTMALSFAQLFAQKKTDLMRPFGGKYPAISAEIDRSMANFASGGSGEAPAGIDPGKFDNSLQIQAAEFDAMYADENAQKAATASQPAPSVFAKIDADGHLTHKKAVVRTLFDMTADNHSSHDRLQRIRGFTIGGKSWAHEDVDAQNVSSLTHFQLGNLFSTLVCYNGTHIGLALSKCTLIKRGLPGSKSPSISAVPLAELSLPSSPYTISGQVFSLIPICSDATEWAWTGDFVSFSLKMKKGAAPTDISRLRNLQFAVSSRLIDPMHHKAHDTLVSEITSPTFVSEQEKTWIFKNQDILVSWNTLWDRLLADRELHDKLPNFTGVAKGSFPYGALAVDGESIVTY
jgi:hypothetical protein